MSAKDNIITLPDDQLRQKSKKVGALSDQVLKIIGDMKAATIDWENSREHELGVALAAVQIGDLESIIIIRNNFDDKDDKSFSVFINPEIISCDGDLEEDYEGCLSVTNIYGLVPRYPKVRLRAKDEHGQEVRIRAEGFLARVFQHEIDHVNGKMFVDHLRGNKTAFYKLTREGKLESVDYEKVRATGIFRD